MDRERGAGVVGPHCVTPKPRAKDGLELAVGTEGEAAYPSGLASGSGACAAVHGKGWEDAGRRTPERDLCMATLLGGSPAPAPAPPPRPRPALLWASPSPFRSQRWTWRGVFSSRGSAMQAGRGQWAGVTVGQRGGQLSQNREGVASALTGAEERP